MLTNSIELLGMVREIRGLLDTNWTSGALARDRSDNPVHPLDEKAEQWCLLGAIGKISWRTSELGRRDTRYVSLMDQLVAVEPQLFSRTVAIVNDTEGHDAMLRILDRCIEVLEEKILESPGH